MTTIPATIPTVLDAVATLIARSDALHLELYDLIQKVLGPEPRDASQDQQHQRDEIVSATHDLLGITGFDFQVQLRRDVAQVLVDYARTRLRLTLAR